MERERLIREVIPKSLASMEMRGDQDKVKIVKLKETEKS
jgi:hypothetical protein